MLFKNFTIFAIPHITDAYCQCGETLKEVSDGLLGIAFYCPKCENVYRLKLVKVSKNKISKEYLKQARAEAG
jgi:hypothetical protein